MEPTRLDAVARRLGSRRTVLASAALIVAAGLVQASDVAEGRRKRRKICKLEAIRCGKKCVDPRTDARHCGGCGKPCEEGVECVNKVCGG